MSEGMVWCADIGYKLVWRGGVVLSWEGSDRRRRAFVTAAGDKRGWNKVADEKLDLGRESAIFDSLASLSVLAVVDPGLLLGQLLLFYPIEVFFFLGHGLFEGRVLPSGLASRSSWVDVSTVVRVIGLVTYIQVDALDFFSFVAPVRRWKVLRSGCAPGRSVSSGFWPEEALSVCSARLPGVLKSSLLPLRALVVPRGALLLAFAVKVSTSFAREATTFPCSWSFIIVGIDGSPVVRLRVFVCVGRHIRLSVCGCERDRSIPSPPSSSKLWEPKFAPSSFVNRRKAKLT
ncbi:hypothetical protein F2Q68_00021074 [Brassica cretica]|uniref:Uncharacterized protein n=1 Tax=Brassica cretica TaxID=69181 RepID=A0A8S9G1T2_BRACR|nr:hypothetical protein F2Q68_00021074 [Brassica cretica]